MGFSKAVGTNYMNMLNFTGRASRSEFWWFILFQFLVCWGAIGAGIYYVVQNPSLAASLQNVGKFGVPVPEQVWTTLAWSMAIYTVLIWLPATASIVRRLHDSNHSGFWYFIQIIPLIGPIWLFVLLVIPGTIGNNRFGADTVPGRKRKPPAHPAFAAQLEGEELAEIQAQRKAEIKDYYRKNVLTGVQSADA